MIHSLAGGTIRDKKVLDFVKVEIVEGPFVGSRLFFITDFNLYEGDMVIVPLGDKNTRVKAKVLRVDKGVPSDRAPVPVKRAKSVIRKIS